MISRNSVSSAFSCKEVTRNVRCVKATIESSLAGEPRFNILDAGLERRHLLLQLGQVAREDFAAPTLVGEARLDPAQPLGDRVILLLEALEPAVDLAKWPSISRRSSATCPSTRSKRRSISVNCRPRNSTSCSYSLGDMAQ